MPAHDSGIVNTILGAVSNATVRVNVQSALSQYSVQSTPGPSYVEHASRTIFLSSINATPENLLGTFLHEAQHLRDGPPHQVSQQFARADYFGVVNAKVDREASAMAAEVVGMKLNGSTPTGYGYASFSEVDAAWSKVSQQNPGASPEQLRLALKSELVHIIQNNPSNKAVIESQVSRQFLDTYRDGKIDRIGGADGTQSSNAQPASIALISYTVTFMTAIDALPAFETLTVHRGADGEVYIQGTTESGETWWAEVDAEGNSQEAEESGEFTGHVAPSRGVPNIPGWYLNVPTSAPVSPSSAASIELLAGQSIGLGDPRLGAAGPELRMAEALTIAQATFAIDFPSSVGLRPVDYFEPARLVGSVSHSAI